MRLRDLVARTPRSRALAIGATALALLGGALGCGDEESSGEPAAATDTKLTGEERRSLADYDRRIQAHCLSVGRSLINPRAAPSARQQERAFAAADELIALAAAKPAAPLGAGQDTRLFLADVIENLEGSNCDPRMVSHLAQGLASIAPPQ